MNKKKILIVEDQTLSALDIQECLEAADYEVVAISSTGRDALAQVESKHPNLILMDIQLKGEMDGTETAKAIRLRYGLPVLFLTAFTDKATIDRARVAQPYGYIVKPFQDCELLANIEIALYKHQQEISLSQYLDMKPPESV
jgi:CheY-like chemotaxis protein